MQRQVALWGSVEERGSGMEQKLQEPHLLVYIKTHKLFFLSERVQTHKFPLKSEAMQLSSQPLDPLPIFQIPSWSYYHNRLWAETQQEGAHTASVWVRQPTPAIKSPVLKPATIVLKSLSLILFVFVPILVNFQKNCIQDEAEQGFIKGNISWSDVVSVSWAWRHQPLIMSNTRRSRERRLCPNFFIRVHGFGKKKNKQTFGPKTLFFIVEQ